MMESIKKILNNKNFDEEPKGAGKIGTSYTHETGKLDGINNFISEIEKAIKEDTELNQATMAKLLEMLKREKKRMEEKI
jgi:hypothetical protein